jgi:hypothetical protein
VITLTGEAIKMLKEGLDEAMITEILKKKYIDPLLDAPSKKCENRTVKEPITRDRVKGLRDFISYPRMPSGVRKMTRTRRTLLLQKIAAGQAAVEYFSSNDSDPQTSRNISAANYNETQLPTIQNPRNKTTHGLIYLGRVPECKKLKIWLRL